MTALVWKSDTLNGREVHHSEMIPAGVGNATYHASWTWRERTIKPEALVQVEGPRGGLRFINLRKCGTIAEAKRICEQHYADGCDLSRAYLCAIRGGRGAGHGLSRS
jgi:hypothetical protein